MDQYVTVSMYGVLKLMKSEVRYGILSSWDLDWIGDGLPTNQRQILSMPCRRNYPKSCLSCDRKRLIMGLRRGSGARLFGINSQGCTE